MEQLASLADWPISDNFDAQHTKRHAKTMYMFREKDLSFIGSTCFGDSRTII